MAFSLTSKENNCYLESINNNYCKNSNWIPEWKTAPLKTDRLCELVSSAKKINKFTNPNDVVIYVGRSPSILFVINNYLNSEAKHVHINCSSTPGMTGMRKSPENILKNVITPERLAYFEDYAHNAGLDKITDSSQNIYIVDIIGTGAGLNSFIQILHHYLFEYRNMAALPQIKIILMNNKQGNQYEYYVLNIQEKTITFTNSFKYIMPITLPIELLNMSEDVQDALDDDVIQFYSSFGREYPAFAWQEKYESHRDSKAEYGEYLEKFLISYIDIEKCESCYAFLTKILRCGQCKKISYCKRECQLKDWPNHKQFCKNS